jgi:microcystin-dependent protein
MADPFIGEIRAVGFNFAPQGWAMCNGQLLPIAQNTALFSLLGTYYGGNGQTTFALPDLRGRSPMHIGQGPGLTSRVLGEEGGAEGVTLTADQIPGHSHALNASAAKATEKTPTGQVNAVTGPATYGSPEASPTTMSDQAIGSTGGGLAHENMPPFLAINYIIALTGIYPSRP